MLIHLNEMYVGFDGEVNKYGQGTPTVFVRLQGCNLNCTYCDTKYAQKPNTIIGSPPPYKADVTSVANEIKALSIKKVTITGGEPLLQMEAVINLLEQINGLRSSIETNGSIPWQPAKFWCNSMVVDYKLKGSKQQKFMLEPEYFAENLGEHDFVKFVIEDHKDFMEAVRMQEILIKLNCPARFAYSTTTRLVPHTVLSEWMLNKSEILEKAILNVQLHKLIWLVNERRR